MEALIHQLKVISLNKFNNLRYNSTRILITHLYCYEKRLHSSIVSLIITLLKICTITNKAIRFQFNKIQLHNINRKLIIIIQPASIILRQEWLGQSWVVSPVLALQHIILLIINSCEIMQ